MPSILMRAVLLASVALAAAVGCGGDGAVDDLGGVATTGSILGFTTPIRISAAEVVVFVDDQEVRRVEFRDGQFQVDDLPEGVYRLEVRVFGYQTNDAARDIALEAGETLDLGRFVLVGDAAFMADVPRIRGEVTDSVTAAPLADVSVKVTCLAGVCSVQKAVTDEDGAFELKAPTEQEVQVTFTAEGRVAQFLTVAPISAGQTVTLDAELAPDGL
jgi:hypothetical protein